MEIDIEKLLGELDRGPGASEESIQSLLAHIGRSLPVDYIDLLRRMDGADGPFGDGYLVLWSSSKVADANVSYDVEKYAPGMLLIGSDGGDTAYGLDLRPTANDDEKYIETDFIGMGWDSIFFCAGSIEELLKHIANPNT